MLAAWIESLGGVPAAIALATAVTAAAVRCYGLRIRERMHKERLQVAQKLAEAGSTAVLGPDTVIVAPVSSPLTVDEVLRAVDVTAPAPLVEDSPRKQIPGQAVANELPPPVPPA